MAQTTGARLASTFGRLERSIAPSGPTTHHTGCRTTWSAWLPELTEFFPKLLPSSGPIGTNRVSNFGNMAFDVEFILLEPGDVEFLTGGTALELTSNVLLIVADDPGISVSDMLQSDVGRRLTL